MTEERLPLAELLQPILTTISSRCHRPVGLDLARRRLRANRVPNFRVQQRMVSIADLDPALRHEVLDVAKAHGETEVQPDSPADDVRREPMAGVGYGLHRLPLPARRSWVDDPARLTASRPEPVAGVTVTTPGGVTIGPTQTIR